LKQPNENQNRLQGLCEFLAIVGPIICLIDCIVIPVALAVLPLFGMAHIFHGLSDQLLSFIVLGICAPVMIPTVLRHRNIKVLVLMCVGFVSIFFANYLNIGETLHLALSIVGSASLITAGFENRRLNRSACSCTH
jgi:hypothetical protein